jgi:hypothetical protein
MITAVRLICTGVLRRAKHRGLLCALSSPGLTGSPEKLEDANMFDVQIILEATN